MKNKTDFSKSFINLLSGLKRNYPNQSLSTHLYGALIEYDGQFWGISDKELYNCLENYADNLAMEEDIENNVFYNENNFNDEYQEE